MEALRGSAALMKTLEKLGQAGMKQAARALYQEALVESKESQRRTPVDTGALRATHEVQKPRIEGHDVSVAIRVGGPSAPYAVIVHEDLEADHKVGQAKFLESTILESRPFLAERIAKRIDLKQAVSGLGD